MKATIKQSDSFALPIQFYDTATGMTQAQSSTANHKCY